MKIFILPTPSALQLRARRPYPQHNKRDHGIEQDFLEYLQQHSELVTGQLDVADWHYLPVYWTRYHLAHKSGKKGQEFLQQQVSERILDEEKTFTVCQYADGPLANLGKTVQFLGSRKEKGVDVPLVSYPHEWPSLEPAKKWLASFVGRLRTHPIRIEMRRSLGERVDIDIQDGNRGSSFFVEQMLQSYIALCPRGYGCTSFRFYEAMQLGVVPLFISDLDNRPFKTWLDWDQVSLYARSVEEAEEICTSRTKAELLTLGEHAKAIWYRDLAFGKWCGYVFKELGGSEMTSIAEKHHQHALQAEAVWGRAYPIFDELVRVRKLEIGAEIGVAFGGHIEALLNISTVRKMYGIDPYLRLASKYTMKLSQLELNALYVYVLKRLSQFGDRYEHVRKRSVDAADNIPGQLDFVYVDANHSYKSVLMDLRTWVPVVREGGIIGGHDYAHPGLSGVKQAVDSFFEQLDWPVHVEDAYVWWVEKKA